MATQWYQLVESIFVRKTNWNLFWKGHATWKLFIVFHKFDSVRQVGCVHQDTFYQQLLVQWLTSILFILYWLCVHSIATALTVINVTNALQGIGLEGVCLILNILRSKYEEFRHEFPSDEERISAAVRFWMLHDPLAGWRRLVDQLYRRSDIYQDLEAVGDRIRHYAEDLTGMYMYMT